MIKTNDLLMCRLQWPSPPEGYNDKETKHWKKTLAAGRRCLHDHAPIEFIETGFQLLLKSKEADMVECLSLVLAEINLEVDEVLVMLSAPACDDYGDYFYQGSFKQALLQLATGVRAIQDKVKDKPPRVDAFNDLFRQLETLSSYVQSDNLVQLHKYLVKLEDWDYVDEKRKGVVLLGKLAEKIEEMEL